MPAKQGTLNKWFSGQNDSKKAEPQQTKLKLESTKESTTKKPTSSEIKPNGASSAKSSTPEDVEMLDAASSNGVKVDSDVEQQGKTSRRSSSDDDDEDEGPVRKRRRTTKTQKSESAKAKPPPSAPTKSKSPKAKKSSSVKGQAKHEDATSAAEVDKPSPKPPKNIKSSKETTPSVDDISTEARKLKVEPATEELEEEEDEVEPEDAAQAREKILTLLKGSGKDPYPDWKSGQPVPYAALCQTFHKIEMTTKRLEILAHCSLFLRQVLRLTPDDLLETVLLMINKLGADYTGVELGIGESLIMKAVGESTGRSLAVIKADQNEIGDLGLVAAKSRSNQPTMFKPKPLTVKDVFKGLKDIATIEGQGSQGRKIAGIKKLLSAADTATAGKGSKGVDVTKDKGGPSEAKYIVRTLEGKLRLGLAEKSVLVALAQAIVFHHAEYAAVQNGKKAKPPSTEAIAEGESILKSVYSELPSYEIIIPTIVSNEFQLDKLRGICKLQPGIPLKPMLAKPTKSITEVLDRFENKHFTCEYKYDGERAQIHFVAHSSSEQYVTSVSAAGKSDKGIANVFSRNSEDLSKKYPDILAKLPTWIKEGVTSFVLDCESVAWDVAEKKVLPFQQLMTRKRKDVKAEEITVKVCVFAFDLLFLNGEALVNKTFRERRELLQKSFEPVEGEFAFATYADANDLDQIQILLDESIKASCEGLMVKMLDGPESSYEPSKRSQNWLKVKKDYLSGVGDSLDLVVLGAYYGRGKRTSVYGAFLLACYNARNETYESVCNIGTGFSDDALAALHTQLSQALISKPKPFYVHSTGNKDQPDVWLEPRFVWEVKTADLTLSPRYRAAAEHVGDGEAGGNGKGVSLRFPRFVRERPDKMADMATTSRAVADMYRRQESVGSRNKGPSVDDEFEY